jgi:amidohydrolase
VSVNREAREGTRPRAADDLLAAASRLLPWMVEIRRDLHRHPELGYEERRTSAQVRARLDELGIEHRDGLAETGVLGLVRGAARGRAKVVALRADLDALPLQDEKDTPYRSQAPGRMHACGHDAHTAILLGAARLLAERSGDFDGLVKLIFQPAEETAGGARRMIAAGVLDDPAVDAIFGLHVDPGLETGRVGLRYGQRNASADALRVVIHGRSAHGAYPSGGVDAIVAAAQVVTALQSVVSRNLDARDSAVVTIGVIQGGSQRNILASRVELQGTVRCLAPQVRELVLRRLRETAEGVAAAMGARAEVEIEATNEPLINDDAMLEIVRRNASDLLGEDRVVTVPRAGMGSEDFGEYLARSPGAFYSLGVRNEATGIVHPLHSERFDVDESALAIGAALQAANALAVLASQPK